MIEILKEKENPEVIEEDINSGRIIKK